MMKLPTAFLIWLTLINLLACNVVSSTPVPAAPTLTSAATLAPPATESPAPSPTPIPVPQVVVLARAVKIAQLVGEVDRETKQPTLNQTQSRYRLGATDLGIPFSHMDRTFLLFGDSGGAHGGDAIAYTTDANPEDGIALTFLTETDGTFKEIRIPDISQKAFEVPTEGTSISDSIYVYHTTDSTGPGMMGRTVLAVSNDHGENFRYLYDLSTRHFIQVSVVEVDAAEWYGLPQNFGDGLIMFGAGEYRKSDVRLAFQPSEQIESAASLIYFAGLDGLGAPAWSAKEEDAQPLFDQPCVGELSVTFNRFLRQWIMLYNCNLEPRGINVRTANNPWGPWSAPQVIYHPEEDNGFCRFIHKSWEQENCDDLSDKGQEHVNGGAYGPYQFEDMAIGDDSQTTIYFTMSTWNPYTVVLMKATLGKGPK